ncbi:ABC transporter permease subunit [Sulfobacillus harzensis]|uniref:Carbohydrate ABC transporter permease n=1 Tax=Sulfobacillus harzensis TaxID=2729629 RepID=A0A7Y0L5Z0_9FIRM|nr:carbohydrate ABC transporter permease [Sulfobacillus harzensis]
MPKISWGRWAIVAALCTAFYLLPLLYLVSVSLQGPRQFLVNPLSLPHPVVWANYVHAWVRADMGTYFTNSVVYTFFATGLALLCSVFLAFPVSRRYLKGSSTIYTLMILGFFLPVGLIPLFIESLVLHLYNNRIGYILLHVQAGVNLGFLFFTGYFQTIPVELDESAAMDGAGYIRYVFQIIMPLAKPALATVGIYAAVAVWNDLIGPVVFLANNNLFPLTRGLYTFYGSYQSDWTLLAAAIFIVAAPLILAFVFVQRYFVQGALSGSIKL